MSRGGKRPGAGRPSGVPNKATAEARNAIASFVDGNAHRLQQWLDEIANGVPALDEKGKVIPGRFSVRPDPVKAFELFQSVIEYHVPKLARSDVKVEGEIVTYVAHMPAPVKDADDWLERSK